MPEIAAMRSSLEEVEQDHLLTFADTLPEDERAALLGEIGALELDRLPELIERFVRNPEDAGVPARLEPAPYLPRVPGEGGASWDPAAARRAGEELIRAGKVACFTVAGGQGTRLGHDGPKGTYPTACITGKPLFQLFAEQIRASGDRWGVSIPWYIMTSPLNHDATVSFFRDNDHFGLDPEDVMMFPQGTMPSFDKSSGRILLASRGRVATNPDGHGGSLTALWKSGAIDDMNARGVEHISYFQVDNPHVRAVDPVFLGVHASGADSSGEMSSKMLPKASWDEKVGVFCAVDGRVVVIEYSDLPEDLAKETDADGSLRFNAGNIAVHALGVAFVEKLNADPSFALPFHRAVKKVPFVDPATGEAVEPDEPNAVKLERFVFDAIPLADRSAVLETDRVEEFAPVKNATGVDSIESSKALQTERAARWLEAAGVTIPRKDDGTADAVIEISPLTALEADDLKGKDLPGSIEPGSEVML